MSKITYNIQLTVSRQVDDPNGKFIPAQQVSYAFETASHEDLVAENIDKVAAITKGRLIGSGVRARHGA